VVVDVAEVSARVRHEDWLADAVRRFGKDPLDWRFECPFCGNVTSGRDWVNAGCPIVDAHRVSIECIGRLRGVEARGGMKEGREVNPDGTPAQPCDWAAFGLFGNLGKGPVIIRRDEETGEERETQAFPFAEA
jgi:hypothetical protein